MLSNPVLITPCYQTGFTKFILYGTFFKITKTIPRKPIQAKSILGQFKLVLVRLREPEKISWAYGAPEQPGGLQEQKHSAKN